MTINFVWKFTRSARVVATALVAAFATPSLAQQDMLDYTNEIAPGVYSVGGGDGYHSMVLVTDDGVAVFETVSTAHSEKVVEAVRKLTDQPIKYAFQTHNHWDHSSGGKVFQDLGAKTVMHAYAAEWLDAHPGSDTTPPDMTFTGPLNTFTLGGKTIEAHYVGLNHGMGMTVYVLPETRTAYIADLVTPNRVQFTIMPDFNVKELERSLHEVLELGFDKAVCSHTELPAEEAINGCTKVHVQETINYLSDLRNAIVTELKKGTPSREVPALVELPQYAHWDYYDEWLEMNAWRVMIDLGIGPFPWIPGQSN